MIVLVRATFGCTQKFWPIRDEYCCQVISYGESNACVTSVWVKWTERKRNEQDADNNGYLFGKLYRSLLIDNFFYMIGGELGQRLN